MYTSSKWDSRRPELGPSIHILLNGLSGISAQEVEPIGPPVFDTLRENPQRVVVSPDGKDGYTPSHWRSGPLVRYERTPATGDVGHLKTLKDDRLTGSNITPSAHTPFAAGGVSLTKQWCHHVGRIKRRDNISTSAQQSF